MAGVAPANNARADGFDTHFLREFNALRHIRQCISSRQLNKMGFSNPVGAVKLRSSF
jgi:hypothetical protein